MLILGGTIALSLSNRGLQEKLVYWSQIDVYFLSKIGLLAAKILSFSAFRKVTTVWVKNWPSGMSQTSV